MPRVVQSLWFEEVGLVHEPLLDTPVGRLTLRQTAALTVSALAAWLVSLPFMDMICKVVVASIVFIFGAVVSTHRVKTVPLERCILLALGIARPVPRKPRKSMKKPERSGKCSSAWEAQIPVKAMRLPTELDAPVKIEGVLRDSATGELLSRRGFEFIVDSEQSAFGETDENGSFTVFFAPKRFGVHRVEVKPEGYADASQKFEIHAEPKRGVRAV